MSGRGLAALALAALLALPAHAADKIGIFETIYRSSASHAETVAAIETAATTSGLELHAVHAVRVPDDAHSATVFVLTSPAYLEAAAAESPRTISAQILRINVYTWGDNQQTYVNMANPVAHAMVFYAESANYAGLVAAAGSAADELRALVADVPGEAMTEQLKPLRKEKHYRKYNGDGPARMMAGFKRFEKSQQLVTEEPFADLDTAVERVVARIDASEIVDEQDPQGWEKVAVVRVRDDVAWIGITSPYVEDRMVRINSRFRGKDKTDLAPYPGVDHMTALPVDLLVVREESTFRVLQYGEMWRMQLYFWDSGYRAFTANMNVPGKIEDSIEDAIGPREN